MSTPTKEEVLTLLACLESFDAEAVDVSVRGHPDRADILAALARRYVEHAWFDDYRNFCEHYIIPMMVGDLEKILASVVLSGAFDAFPVAEAIGRELTQLELLELSVAEYGESREDALDRLKLHDVPIPEIPDRVLGRMRTLAIGQYQLMRQEPPEEFGLDGLPDKANLDFRTLRWLHEASIARLCYSTQ